MSPSHTTTSLPEEVLLAAQAADAKLGHDTVVLDMAEALGVVDAFVITSGANVRQVRTMVEEIEQRLKHPGAEAEDRERRRPLAVEGLADGSWVLMDYGDFVVHVFLEETRRYYDLEHLWVGAPRVSWQPAEAHA